MSPNDKIFALLSRSSVSGGRSTVLQPLGWLTFILTTGLVGSITYDAEKWLQITIVSFLAAIIVVYLTIYIRFAFKDPDALRSEKFTLSKLALEKNLIGDSQHGLKEISDICNTDSSSPVAINDQRQDK